MTSSVAAVSALAQRNLLLRGGSAKVVRSTRASFQHDGLFLHRLASQHQNHLLQVRHNSYVPLAYRQGSSKAKQLSQTRPRLSRSGAGSKQRGRTPPGRRGRRGPRGGAADASRGNRSSKKGNSFTGRSQQQSSLEYNLQGRKDDLLRKQKELENGLAQYRESLGNLLQSTAAGDLSESSEAEAPGEIVTDDVLVEKDTSRKKRKKRKGGKQHDSADTASPSSSHQVTALISQLSDIHVNLKPETWSHVKDTEEGYRQICHTVGEMIDLATNIQKLSLKKDSKMQQQQRDRQTDPVLLSYYSGIAEQLLGAWIDLQQDRSEFVKTVKAQTSDAGGLTKTWFGWLKNEVMDAGKEVVSDNTTDADTDASKPPMAHEDPLCGPRLEHFQNIANTVLQTLREDMRESRSNANSNQTPFRKIRRAQRLKQLLEKMPQKVVPDVPAIQTLMNAFAIVGSYESARACESLAEKYPDMQDDLLATVLHGFFLAARSSPRNQERTKSAMRADELVRQRWANSSRSDDYEENKFIHGTKALLCLHAVGPDAVPDICKRADTLANLCVGRDNLESVFRSGNLESLWKIARPQITLPFLNCLTLIYASSGDTSRVLLAKRLLLILLKDSDFQSNKDVPFPDVRTCKAVLSGLLAISDKKARLTPVNKYQKKSHPSPKDSEGFQETLNYGFELLDLMMAHPQCWPDQQYFQYLLRLLLMARPKGVGDVAEQLLSKMHVQECFGLPGFTLVTRKTYEYVLLAWLSAAKQKAPGAAKRTVDLLDLMEAQSLPLFPADEKGSDAYKHCVAPDRSTIQLALSICSSVKIHDEKEEALDCALAIYYRSKKRGINPTSETFSQLFACCANLLPESSKRRQSVTQLLLEDARSQGNVNETVLEKLKSQNAAGSSTTSIVGGSGGLLADLN